jgi:hypothetical protein
MAFRTKMGKWQGFFDPFSELVQLIQLSQEISGRVGVGSNALLERIHSETPTKLTKNRNRRRPFTTIAWII